jgi:hypothetical protein
MKLTRTQQQQVKRDVLNRVWDMFAYPEVTEDYTDEQRLYVKELTYRIAKHLNISEF